MPSPTVIYLRNRLIVKHLDAPFSKISRALWNTVRSLALGLMAIQFFTTVLSSRADAQAFTSVLHDEVDGLPSAQAYALEFDASGVLWVATRKGTARYDGLRWSGVADKRNIAKGWEPRWLVFDSEQRVWAIPNSARHPVSLQEGTTSKLLPPLEFDDNSLVRISAAAAVTTTRGRFLYLGTTTKGVWIWDGAVWISVRCESGNEKGLGEVRSLVARGEKVLVAGSEGIFEIDGSVARKLNSNSSDPRLRQGLAILPWGDPDTCIVAGRRFTGILNADGLKLLSCLDSFYTEFTAESAFLCLDGFGGFYLATGESLYQVDVEKDKATRLNLEMTLGPVTSLKLDHERNLWTSGLRGLRCIPPPRFANWRKNQGLMADEVGAILRLDAGKLLLGHFGGVTILQGSQLTRIIFDQRRDAQAIPTKILDMAMATNERAWIAGNELGIGLLDLKGPHHECQWWRLPGAQDLTVSGATSVLADNHGGCWISSTRGLFHLQGGELSFLDSEVLNRGLRRLFRDSKGRCYVASNGGGIIRSANGFDDPQILTGPEEFGFRDVFCFLEDKSGKIWVGTRSGLLVIEGDRLRRPREARFAIEEPIYSMALQPQGRLAIGTSQGLLIDDGKRLRRFTAEDGLAGMEANRAAMVYDEMGDLWIGTNMGLSRVRSGFDDSRPTPSFLKITEIKTSEGVRDLALSTMESAGRQLSFRFHTPSFHRASDLEYRTRLQGLEQDWVLADTEGKGFVNFEHLSHGEYQLEVQVRRPAEPWSNTVKSATVTLQGPFWTAGWFWLVCGALLVILGFIAIRALMDRRVKDQLETMVERRTRDLKASERHFRESFHSNRAAQLQLDAETTAIIGANPAACRFFGYLEDEIFGADFSAFSVGREELVREQLINLNRSSGLRHQLVQQTASGEDRDVEIFASLVETPRGWVIQCTVHDVTDSKQIERELHEAQKLNAVGRLASGIAHDFNNLLLVIQGNADVATGKSKANESVDNELQEIRSASQRGSKLIRDLLVFSRRHNLRREVFNMDQFLVGLRPTFGHLLGSNRRLKIDLHAENAQVETDPVQFERVLNNLITNARDATQANGKVQVRTRELPASESALEVASILIEVEDDGCGIDELDINRVFEPFFTTKEVGSGTGLGLASAHGVVARSGGRLEFESELGKGTTFRILLPLAGAVKDSSAEGIPSHSAAVIVAVQDSEARSRTTTIVENLGFQVLQARGAADALRLFHESTAAPHALLADLEVTGSGMSGEELAYCLRSEQPSIRIVLIARPNRKPRKLEDAILVSKAASKSELAKALGRGSDLEANSTV